QCIPARVVRADIGRRHRAKTRRAAPRSTLIGAVVPVRAVGSASVPGREDRRLLASGPVPRVDNQRLVWKRGVMSVSQPHVVAGHCRCDRPPVNPDKVLYHASPSRHILFYLTTKPPPAETRGGQSLVSRGLREALGLTAEVMSPDLDEVVPGVIPVDLVLIRQVRVVEHVLEKPLDTAFRLLALVGLHFVPPFFAIISSNTRHSAPSSPVSWGATPGASRANMW